MKNPDWASYVNAARRAARITKRELAQRSGVDPSYVTLMERDGYIPSRSKVEAMARALDHNLSDLMLAAGYATPDLSERLKERTFDLDPKLLAVLGKCRKLSPTRQAGLAKIIKAFMEVECTASKSQS